MNEKVSGVLYLKGVRIEKIFELNAYLYEYLKHIPILCYKM